MPPAVPVGAETVHAHVPAVIPERDGQNVKNDQCPQKNHELHGNLSIHTCLSTTVARCG